MSRSFPYDDNYTPAAPVATIGLGPSGEAEARQQVEALLDSGADGSMIPIDLLIACGARFVERRQMRGVVGGPVPVSLLFNGRAHRRAYHSRYPCGWSTGRWRNNCRP